MSPDDGDDAQEEYVSGPYCEHWSEPSDCTMTCVVCSHFCGSHNGGCCDLCECEKFTEKEE